MSFAITIVSIGLGIMFLYGSRRICLVFAGWRRPAICGAGGFQLVRRFFRLASSGLPCPHATLKQFQAAKYNNVPMRPGRCAKQRRNGYFASCPHPLLAPAMQHNPITMLAVPIQTCGCTASLFSPCPSSNAITGVINVMSAMRPASMCLIR